MGQALEPVAGGERIGAIDSVRGFALLGIFLVNIQSFGEPFGEFLTGAPTAGAGWGEAAAYYFVKIFCESKFYPLFAMLFGFGLMMQAQRAADRGRSYWGQGARRYLFLTLLGLSHALLLWYGDILFIYGIGGMVLLLMHRASTTALACTGGALLAIGVVLMTGFSLLTGGPSPQGPDAARSAPITANAEPNVTGVPGVEAASIVGDGIKTKPDANPAPSEPARPAPPADGAARVIGDGKIGGRSTPVLRLFQAFREGKAQGGPMDPTWVALEREAYTDGSPMDRLLFNAFTWAMFLVVCLFGFGWDVLAMLLLGAVLFRLRVFDPSRAHWHRRFVVIGLVLALPMCAAAAFAGKLLPHALAGAVFSAVSMLAGPLISLAYLGGITLLVRNGSAGALTGALACVGRLALSNYLLQTLVATTIFYHWGLGLFDETSRVQRLGMVAGIFACQVLLSVAWLRVFRTGPMEWVWRTVTYLRPPSAGTHVA